MKIQITYKHSLNCNVKTLQTKMPVGCLNFNYTAFKAPFKQTKICFGPFSDTMSFMTRPKYLPLNNVNVCKVH